MNLLHADKPWPDWSGLPVVIVATGPTAAQVDLEVVRGRAYVLVIKQSYRLAPWADALYGCDRGWWVFNQGAKGFDGLKFSPSPTVCKVFPDVRFVGLKNGTRLLMQKGTVSVGARNANGNSGFQLLNLAAQCGAKQIYLVGYDMTLENGAHWHRDYAGVAKPDTGRVKSWLDGMEECAKQCEVMGIEVINTSPVSVMRGFVRGGLPWLQSV